MLSLQQEEVRKHFNCSTLEGAGKRLVNYYSFLGYPNVHLNDSSILELKTFFILKISSFFVCLLKWPRNDQPATLNTNIDNWNNHWWNYKRAEKSPSNFEMISNRIGRPGSWWYVADALGETSIRGKTDLLIILINHHFRIEIRTIFDGN